MVLQPGDNTETRGLKNEKEVCMSGKKLVKSI
jgi:hypothetical protein